MISFKNNVCKGGIILHKKLENIAIPPPYITNNQGENKLLWDSSYTEERRRSFMFGSIDNINLLSQSDHLMLDGTFSSAPQMWQQLLSVHVLFDSGWHLPLVYGLIPGKTQVLYTDFLSELDTFGGFDPQSVLRDFEKGLHNAISSVWPSASVRALEGAISISNRPCGGSYRRLIWFLSTRSCPLLSGDGSRPLVLFLS